MFEEQCAKQNLKGIMERLISVVEKKIRKELPDKKSQDVVFNHVKSHLGDFSNLHELLEAKKGLESSDDSLLSFAKIASEVLSSLPASEQDKVLCRIAISSDLLGKISKVLMRYNSKQLLKLQKFVTDASNYSLFGKEHHITYGERKFRLVSKKEFDDSFGFEDITPDNLHGILIACRREQRSYSIQQKKEKERYATLKNIFDDAIELLYPDVKESIEYRIYIPENLYN